MNLVEFGWLMSAQHCECDYFDVEYGALTAMLC